MSKKKEALPATPGFTVPASEQKEAKKRCKTAAKLLTKRNRLLKKVEDVEHRLTARTGLTVTQVNGLTGRVKRRQVAKTLGYPS